MEIYNSSLKNKELVTSISILKFNNKGVAQLEDKNLYEELLKLKGYNKVVSNIDTNTVYEQYSIKQLEDIADEKGIKIPSNITKKADIIGFIKGK